MQGISFSYMYIAKSVIGKERYVFTIREVDTTKRKIVRQYCGSPKVSYMHSNVDMLRFSKPWQSYIGHVYGAIASIQILRR